MTLGGIQLCTEKKWHLGVFFLIVIFSSLSRAHADAKDEVWALESLWKANAPTCEDFPSSNNCHDGDMTLFNGLLCSVGESLGCEGVKAAQASSGRWYRSPRFAKDPSKDPRDSFSWDMALGIQLYAATTGDKAALSRWLRWVEASRPCLVQSPDINGKTYCLVRGWPRWCPDDTENGCLAKPQNLATLVRTADRLAIALPDPAEDTLPDGVAGAILNELQKQAREANKALSLGRLMAAARELQPTILLIDAAVNKPGYSRHLVGTEILLARKIGLSSPDIDLAARILAGKEPTNPFFQYLNEGGTSRVATLVLAIAPRSLETLPKNRDDWTWQREEQDQAWLNANLWDFVFISKLLLVDIKK